MSFGSIPIISECDHAKTSKFSLRKRARSSLKSGLRLEPILSTLEGSFGSTKIGIVSSAAPALSIIGGILGSKSALPDYVEESIYQFLLHIQNLMDRETGLWFHGWNYDGQHNFAKARWARGNSWLTIVIPDFLELVDLPENNAVRRYLVQVLDAQIAALAKCQDESGLWHTLLDDPNSYLESSATAGFAYGILKAVRKRYVSAEYADVAERAIRGIVKNISAEGELLQTSFGTGMGSNLEFYRQIPRTSMPYGQAMAILCLTEYLRKYF